VAAGGAGAAASDAGDPFPCSNRPELRGRGAVGRYPGHRKKAPESPPAPSA
jgi:hypothetical protein